MDETYVYDHVKEIYKSCYLKDGALNDITAFIKYCLVAKPSDTPIHFGFMVQTDKYIKNSFIIDFMKIISKFVSSSILSHVVSEHDLLNNPTEAFEKLNVYNVLFQSTKESAVIGKSDLKNSSILNNRSVLFIKDCDESPMSEPDHSRWDEIAEIFRKEPSVTPILLASAESLNNRFKGHDDLYYRIFRYRITSKKSLSMTAVESELYNELHDHDLKEDDSFRQEIHKYIETIYEKADLKGIEFVLDLVDRVIGSYYHKPQLDGIIDSTCVPFYRKPESTDVKAENSSSPEKPIIQEDKTTPVPDDQDRVETIDIKDYVPKTLNDSVPDEVNNVFLLALSTFPSNHPMVEFTYSCSYEGNDYTDSYFYQMEPVIDLLSNHLHKKNEHIDEIILLVTEKTVEKVENVKIITADNKTNTLIMSDRENSNMISPLDYFVYSFNKRNPGTKTKFSLHYCDSNEKTGSIAKTIHEVLDELRDHKKAKVYVDIHGGIRSTQQLVSSILSLLHLEGIGISSNNVFNVRKDGYNTSFIENAGNTFRIMDFVSGMNEFMSYGRTGSLERFYKTEKKAIDLTAKSPTDASQGSESNIVSIFKEIASGIQLCDINSFENGLDKLKDIDISAQNPDSFLSIFWNDVEANYKGLLGADRTVLDEIKWCISKGFFQQALTLIESRMPEELINRYEIINIQNSANYNDSVRTPVSRDVLLNFKCKNTISSPVKEYTLKDVLDSNRYSWVNPVNLLFERWGTTCYVVNTKHNRASDKNEKLYLNLKSSLDTLKRQKRDNINNPQNLKSYIKSLDTSVCGCKYDRPVFFEIKDDSSATTGKVQLRLTPVRKDIKIQFEKFMCLHMTLKNQRNSSNHASDDSYSMDIIEWALRAYVALAEECFNNSSKPNTLPVGGGTVKVSKKL